MCAAGGCQRPPRPEAMRARLRKLGAIDNLERLAVLAPAHQIVRRGRRDDLEELYQEGRDLQRRTGGGRTHVWLRVTLPRGAGRRRGEWVCKGSSPRRRERADNALSSSRWSTILRGGESPPECGGCTVSVVRRRILQTRLGGPAAHRLAGGGGSAGSLRGASREAARAGFDRTRQAGLGADRRRLSSSILNLGCVCDQKKKTR